MKLKSIFVLCLLLSLAFAFSGCSFDLYKEAVARVSETRMCLYEAENNKIRVSFSSGMREDPYIINGIAEKLCPFGLVTLEPKDNDLKAEDEISVALVIGNERFNIVLERNPYEYSFGADIGKLFNNPASVVLIVNAFNDIYNLTLANVLEANSINWEGALKIALNVLNAKSIITNSKIKCEIYVKIACDTSRITNKHFWYVSIVTTKGDNLYCLINPAGEVIYKK